MVFGACRKAHPIYARENFLTLEMFHGACIIKETKQLIGFTGLNPYLPKQPELEWQLGVPSWGMGYATEVGRAASVELLILLT